MVRAPGCSIGIPPVDAGDCDIADGMGDGRKGVGFAGQAKKERRVKLRCVKWDGKPSPEAGKAAAGMVGNLRAASSMGTPTRPELGQKITGNKIPVRKIGNAPPERMAAGAMYANAAPAAAGTGGRMSDAASE